ncbi:hypothetical protein BB559_002007 [Furculomyces boomerangus]|uniref:ornithine decarboxylase n=2 Tax=Harpellales TaxID=61421 RepID=A0A2T9YBV1_9FUNG|nr:hypothetical protein BB559_004919 [Furculomyces boomerangus]PVU97518.1 hypothetical protein BB559_002007 [Furculomyces boomerangus]PWA01963.1 hypothetical protein BB558_001910 [Smittium angustum]
MNQVSSLTSSMIKPSLSSPKTAKYLLQPDLLKENTLTSSSLSEVLQSITSSPDAEDSFFVADISIVYEQYQTWIRELPRIQPFFAVKSNPDPVIIKILASLGTGFDCASKTEIKQILDMGISPDRIIYAHPCKPSSHLKYATKSNVNLMTFDNTDELYKIKSLAPDAEVVLRISTDDSNALCRFSIKFGADLANTEELLNVAKSLGINVVGVSFHIGSGSLDVNAFSDALRRARFVFDQAKQLGFEFSLLDIGGGFPSSKQRGGIDFKSFARNLDAEMNRLFPVSEGIRIISEPGRYFSSSPFSLAVNVTSKRTVDPNTTPYNSEAENSSSPSDEVSFMYYVNDGVYGSFNCIMFDHRIAHPEILTREGAFELGKNHSNVKHYKTSIWGPTCDSIDCIVQETSFPELYVGDWILFQDMGAYSGSAASKFNGFDTSPVYYYDSRKQ